MIAADDDENQRLHWQLKELEARGISQRERFARMRRLCLGYERAAMCRFDVGDSMAWSDLFAAITWAAEAGDRPMWHRLIDDGRRRARGIDGGDEIEAELNRLYTWARTLSVVPSLTSFGVAVPIPPRRSAA